MDNKTPSLLIINNKPEDDKSAKMDDQNPPLLAINEPKDNKSSEKGNDPSTTISDLPTSRRERDKLLESTSSKASISTSYVEKPHEEKKDV